MREMITLPYDEILHWPKFKAFADNNLNVVKIIISLYVRVENSEKRRKCWLPAFSPFPTLFSKGFFLIKGS